MTMISQTVERQPECQYHHSNSPDRRHFPGLICATIGNALSCDDTCTALHLLPLPIGLDHPFHGFPNVLLAILHGPQESA